MPTACGCCKKSSLVDVPVDSGIYDVAKVPSVEVAGSSSSKKPGNDIINSNRSYEGTAARTFRGLSFVYQLLGVLQYLPRQPLGNQELLHKLQYVRGRWPPSTPPLGTRVYRYAVTPE